MPNPTTDSRMYITMHRQPADLRRLDNEGWMPAREAAARIAGARRIIVTGIGTSFHAALVGGWLLRASGLDARAVLSPDLALYPDNLQLQADDAVIVMAHTGVKRYSGEAMARAAAVGATVISIGSQTADHPGSQQILRTVEREQSAAYTASHLAAMVVLAQLATEVGMLTGAPGTAGFREALAALPDLVAGVLAREAELEPIARMAVAKRVYAAGAGPNEATALELVIKVREAALGWIDALAIEQFLHGPVVAFNAGDLAVIVNAEGKAADRVAEITRAIRLMGGAIWTVGAETGVGGVHYFALPVLPELISPLLAVVPMQMLAYQMAALKGVHPDTFRRDDPIYKDAFGSLKL